MNSFRRIEDYTFANDFLRLFEMLAKNVKNALFEIWKKRKIGAYVLSNTAVNMKLLAAATRAPAAIDRCMLLSPGLRQVADIDRRDRQTDVRTPDCYVNPAPYTLRAVSINVAITK